MKTTSALRLANFIAFLCVLALLGFVTYLQSHDGLTPCALCILQRFTFSVLGVAFFLAAVFSFKKWSHLFFNTLAFLISICGIILAGRQVWLQHAPSSLVGNCDVSLNYMLQALPLVEVIKRVFVGGSECSQISWEFLHLSLAEWSLICFIVFGLFSLNQIRKILFKLG